jgi:hypothetical protein
MTPLSYRTTAILWRLPLRVLRDGPPGIVLRPSRLDPPMSASRREITFNDIGTDHDHGLIFYIRIP